MVENTKLRQDQDRAGSNPFKMYDVEYFRTKYNLTTQEVIDAIHEVKSNNAIDLDEYLSEKTGIPKDKA